MVLDSRLLVLEVCERNTMCCSLRMNGLIVIAAVLLLPLVAFCGSTNAQDAEAADAVQDVSAEITVLASGAPRHEKVNACRRLAAVGGPAAIPTLATLLTDEQLSHPARMALEAMPYPEAGEALRSALPNLDGDLLIGAINSLAARRQVDAVNDVAVFLSNEDAEVAAAACTALGTIASPDAISRLQMAVTGLPSEALPAWGNACLRAVVTLREKGQVDQSLQLCQLIRQAELPRQIHLAAARQMALMRPQQAMPIFQQLLTSPDDDDFAMALTVSRELEPPQVSDVLLANLPNLPPKRQIQVILALANRDGQVAGGASAVPALIPLLEDPDQETRLAAVQALGQVIGVAELSVLTSRLLNVPDGAERRAIQAALVAACRRMPGNDQCARQLQTVLPAADAETKVFLIELLGLVGSETALDAVARLARQPQDDVQDAATRVLGQWRTPDVAPVLLELAQHALQQKYRTRALRGYLRVARQMDLPDAERLAIVRQALEVATRAEEQNLALQTLHEIASIESLEIAAAQLTRRETQEAASEVVVAIAERLASEQQLSDSIRAEEKSQLTGALEQVLTLSTNSELTARARGLLEKLDE
jgi:HEAT repeat protein